MSARQFSSDYGTTLREFSQADVAAARAREAEAAARAAVQAEVEAVAKAEAWRHRFAEAIAETKRRWGALADASGERVAFVETHAYAYGDWRMTGAAFFTESGRRLADHEFVVNAATSSERLVRYCGECSHSATSQWLPAGAAIATPSTRRYYDDQDASWLWADLIRAAGAARAAAKVTPAPAAANPFAALAALKK